MRPELRLLLLGLLAVLWSCGDQAGSELFARHCASCHGPDGRGDGPRASTLQHSPRDLTHRELISLRTDTELAAVVRDGGPALGLTEEMPAFPELSEEEIRHLVRHVRWLGR